jgi:hypothetical protein
MGSCCRDGSIVESRMRIDSFFLRGELVMGRFWIVAMLGVLLCGNTLKAQEGAAPEARLEIVDGDKPGAVQKGDPIQKGGGVAAAQAEARLEIVDDKPGHVQKPGAVQKGDPSQKGGVVGNGRAVSAAPSGPIRSVARGLVRVLTLGRLG